MSYSDARLRDAVLRRLHELAVVPAPLGEEAERAAIVAGWWRADGLDEIHIDEAGNVLALARPGCSGRSVFLCAHLDTVFPRSVEHGIVERDGRLYGPGVGDNSVAVAALGALPQLLPPDTKDAVWLVATVGEEGLGNLRGAKHLVASRPDLAHLIAVEGVLLGQIGIAGQGSVRASITITGPGGHSWIDRDRDSAVHGAARAITFLDRERPREPDDWSWHVAAMSGGGDINVLADSASFTFEIRAPDQAALDEREAQARDLIAQGAGPELKWAWADLGRRPGGGIPKDHPLVQAAVAAHQANEQEWRIETAGTDANAAYGADLPAITLGITTGDEIHTTGEWIDPAPIPTGLRVLADTVAGIAG